MKYFIRFFSGFGSFCFILSFACFTNIHLRFFAIGILLMEF